MIINSRNIPIFCNSSVFAKPDFSKWVETPEKHKNEQFDDILGECILEVFEARNRQRPATLQEGLHNSVALKSYGSMMLAKDEAVNEANVSLILLEATKKLVKLKHIELDSIQSVNIGEDFGKKSDSQCNPKNLPCDSTNPYRYIFLTTENFKLNHFQKLHRMV